MVKLTDKLLEVCNKSAEPSKNYSMDKICRGLIRLTNSRYVCIFLQQLDRCYLCLNVFSSFCCSEFSCIMVPLQSSLTVTLPASSGCSATHNAFPGFQPTIETFEDKVVNVFIYWMWQRSQQLNIYQYLAIIILLVPLCSSCYNW